MPHSALVPNNVAVITGGASGIGRAAAARFARAGMRVALIDQDEAALEAVQRDLNTEGAAAVIARRIDVRDRSALGDFAEEIAERWSGADILMANAGVGLGSRVLAASESWETILGVNLWGAIHTVQAFGPRMAARGRPGAIICTGSKQGITTPPGNPAYNVSKSALKTFAESLAHELRNTDGNKVTAHLLIPGFVFTPLTGQGTREKPQGAWTPGQTADFMLDRLAEGDFYILCPDNDVPRALDEKRMAWAVGDIIENRPALSRWHPDWTDAFDRFVADTPRPPG